MTIGQAKRSSRTGYSRRGTTTYGNNKSQDHNPPEVHLLEVHLPLALYKPTKSQLVCRMLVRKHAHGSTFSTPRFSGFNGSLGLLLTFILQL